MTAAVISAAVCVLPQIVGNDRNASKSRVFLERTEVRIFGQRHFRLGVLNAQLNGRRRFRVGAGIGTFEYDQKQTLDFVPKESGDETVSEIAMQKTLKLVECAMLAATSGLAYFLSNLFRFDAYFGFFFPLPIVISAMRWGAGAGRKTMVTTSLLLLVLGGPLKAATYVLMHGLLGVTMGALWRRETKWGPSIAICTLVRSVGAIGFVLLTSWLIRENILKLITINIHASLSYAAAAMGINFGLTMPVIYALFTLVLLVNCVSFVLLLHVVYAIIFRSLGINSAAAPIPGWLAAAM